METNGTADRQATCETHQHSPPSPSPAAATLVRRRSGGARPRHPFVRPCSIIIIVSSYIKKKTNLITVLIIHRAYSCWNVPSLQLSGWLCRFWWQNSTLKIKLKTTQKNRKKWSLDRPELNYLPCAIFIDFLLIVSRPTPFLFPLIYKKNTPGK